MYWFGNQQCNIGGPGSGPGKVIVIGEVKFGRSKYGSGREVEGKWVFGIYERETKKLLLFLVEKKDSQTLIPIIQHHILPGSTIYSDKGGSYSNLGALGYIHATADLSEPSVDEAGIHTQNIERCWQVARAWVLRSGNKVSMYLKYLARYLFIRAYPKDERVHHFLKSAAQLHPHTYSA